MINTRPLIGRGEQHLDHVAVKVDGVSNPTSPNYGALNSVFKERELVNTSAWRKGMISPASTHQYASMHDLQINTKHRKNNDLDMYEAKPTVNVKFPVALQ